MTVTGQPLLGIALAGMLIGSAPITRAATPKAKSSQSTSSPTAKPAQKKTIARDPYVGAIVVDAASGKTWLTVPRRDPV